MIKSAAEKARAAERARRCGAALGQALRCGAGAPRRAAEIVDHLIDYDPLGLTGFEFSFKVKDKRAAPLLRFLSLDADAYSCRNEALYRTRLAAYESIMRDASLSARWPDVRAALCSVAATPVDLYFGADVSERGQAMYGFWLIFGGVKRDGVPRFCGHDVGALIDGCLKAGGFRKPPRLRPDILNLGFDVLRDDALYKVYYLCREPLIAGRSFSAIMRELSKKLVGFRYFHFYSETYDRDGRKVKEKLFVEFLEDIAGDTPRTRQLIEALNRVDGLNVDAGLWRRILSQSKSRISLISFEADGTLTVYVRP
jgi:hypothetical protein